MPPTIDETFMRRALDLAIHGRGTVEPNPLAGCVIVRDDNIIAEGYHQQFGGPHAERVALAELAAKGLSSEGATAYVTLEPCCHTNKKTPPCAPALIEAKLKRVVIGCLDPNPAVSGNGIARLRAAGLDVTTGVLEPECKQVNAPFFARVLHHRPYVTLKWAESADGKVAGPHGQRRQISKPDSTRVVHGLRARSDAILVGINTVLTDDPMLTARGVDNPRLLRRLVLDSSLRTPLSSRLVATARDTPVIVYCHPSTLTKSADLVDQLSAAGVEIVPLDADTTGRLSLRALLAELHSRDVTHLLVEAGPTIAQSFFKQQLADRIWVIRSSACTIGDRTAPRAPKVPFGFEETLESKYGTDYIIEYIDGYSAVYFSTRPMPDLDLPPAPRSCA